MQLLHTWTTCYTHPRKQTLRMHRRRSGVTCLVTSPVLCCSGAGMDKGRPDCHHRPGLTAQEMQHHLRQQADPTAPSPPPAPGVISDSLQVTQDAQAALGVPGLGQPSEIHGDQVTSSLRSITEPGASSSLPSVTSFPKQTAKTHGCDQLTRHALEQKRESGRETGGGAGAAH